MILATLLYPVVDQVAMLVLADRELPQVAALVDIRHSPGKVHYLTFHTLLLWVRVGQQLAVAMREETTVQIRYLIRLLPPAAAVGVLHLSLLLMEKMAARAVEARKGRQAAQEFRDKVLQEAQGALHRVVAAGQVLSA